MTTGTPGGVPVVARSSLAAQLPVCADGWPTTIALVSGV
jgi:hypothetical protein